MSEGANWPAMMNFANWLSTTPPSVWIQQHEVWAIPTIQSIHIVGIGVIIGSALMVTLRILGVAGRDQTPLENQRRFGPWITGSLIVLLLTGLLMVVGEPVRELVTISFWFKMTLVVVITLLAVALQLTVRDHDTDWAEKLFANKSFRIAALATFVIWACIIFLGRFIAYDHIWGHLSPATKA
jgi:hypothetical protein